MNEIYIIFLSINLFALGLVIYFGYKLDYPKKFKFKPERIYIIFDNTFKSRVFIGDYKEWIFKEFLTPQYIKAYRNILNNYIIYLIEIQHYWMNNKILFISHSKEKFEKYLKKHEKELV